MKNTKLVSSNKGAFSLVEMLVVIAVIGVLAAIAVPNIGRINDAANESKDRRNAQQLASVANAAQAAGYDFVAEDGPGAADVVSAIVTGTTIDDPTSPFDETYFGVPNMSAQEQEDALLFLGIENGMLVYDSGNEEGQAQN